MYKIASLIKYEGDNKTFVWKYPKEDFTNLTQLVVHESQEAIFFKNGQALDLFGAGRYTLETQNLPKLFRFIERASGTGETPFHCEVYYINKTVQMGLKWGTPDQIRFLDPKYHVPLQIGVSGEMNLSVSDSRKLLVKLVGTERGIAWHDQSEGFAKSLENSFRGMMNMALKSHLANALREENVNILEIDSHLEMLSRKLHKVIEPNFAEYGLEINNFYVTSVALPSDNDANFRKIKELATIELQKEMIYAATDIKTAQADAEIVALGKQGEVEMQRQRIQTDRAKMEAERRIISAQAEADQAVIEAEAKAAGTRMEGLAEADVMAAKGYTQKDVIQAEVQKERARSIAQIGANSGGSVGGSGGGNSMVGDMVNMGMNIALTREVMSQMGDIFRETTGLDKVNSNKDNADAVKTVSSVCKCKDCGAELPADAKFCPKCGKHIDSIEEEKITCPKCGEKTNKDKFCPKCGAQLILTCTKCGNELPADALFCSKCGTGKGE